MSTPIFCGAISEQDQEKLLDTIRRTRKAAELYVEPDMVLPEGKTCGDCRHARRCQALLGERWTTNNEACDWSPARFC